MEREVPQMTAQQDSKPLSFVRAAPLSDLASGDCKVVHVEGRTVALFRVDGDVYAIDNRCPHMGFPLQQGTVKDCILTCHWHHARFDLKSGGTFDPWADDVRAFPVEIRNGDIWIDIREQEDPVGRRRERVREGIERNLPLVIAKAVIFLLDRARIPPRSSGSGSSSARSIDERVGARGSRR